MNRFERLFKTPIRLSAFLLAALVAGCGSGSGDQSLSASGPQSPPTAAGAGPGAGSGGRGPAPVLLGTAGNFAILSVTALTNVAPSLVTGDVGLTNAGGAQIGLTCAQVTGTIFAIDNKGPNPCTVTNAAMLSVAKTDGDNAFNDAIARLPDYSELGAANIGGLNLGPATYHWSTAVTIPANVWLTGGPNDVWIFQIAQSLSVSPGVQIILQGGALPQNVYWAPAHDVELGASSQFKGVLLPAAAVFMRSGASINGRLLAEAVHLDNNTVAP